MRVLVCGGRDFKDVSLVYKTLDETGDIECIISGHARGADSIGEMYADERNIPLDIYPAKWNKYGKSAGFKRNMQMLVEGKPDLVVAFPGGRGTAMMCEIAKEANVDVMEVN